MIDFEYTYKVVASSKKFGTLEVEYSALDQPTILKGIVLPNVGTDVDIYIRGYAPVHEWVYEKLEKQEVEIGLTATVAPQPADATPEAKSNDVADLIASISLSDLEETSFKARVQQVVEEMLATRV